MITYKENTYIMYSNLYIIQIIGILGLGKLLNVSLNVLLPNHCLVFSSVNSWESWWFVYFYFELLLNTELARHRSLQSVLLIELSGLKTISL